MKSSARIKKKKNPFPKYEKYKNLTFCKGKSL